MPKQKNLSNPPSLKAKHNNKSGKKSIKSKKKKLTILGRPVHFIRPRGISLQVNLGFKIVLRSQQWGFISEAQIKSFKRFLFVTKHFKRRVNCLAYPFHEMTKKPSEVRMGKGHGKKILRRVFPVCPGKCLFEARLSRKSFQIIKRMPTLLKRATQKISLPIRVSGSDL